jgi:uncharacterized protein YjgD (DUF1641 family)
MSSAVNGSNGSPSVALDAKAIEGLTRLAARSEEIVALLDIVGSGIARGPEIADNVNGLVQIARDAAGPQGERVAELGAALNRLRDLVGSASFKALETALRDPRTGASIVNLLDRSADLLALVDILDKFVQRGPEFADNVNKLVGVARGFTLPLNVAEFLTALGKLDYVGLISLTNTLYPLLASPQVQTLLTRTEILSEGTLALVNAAATTALEAQVAESKSDAKAGAFGALRGMSDPDVQRTIAFALEFAKRFGATLRAGPTLPKD